jgi:hypothetical protein
VTLDSVAAIDSVKLPLWANIDSLGGVNVTVRGFQVRVLGNDADTLDVSEAGSFSTGTFTFDTPMLPSDTSIVFRAYAGHTDTTYTPWDTTSTSIGGVGDGTYWTINGRPANTKIIP